ncbi:HAMP domain-containing protein [Deinococcus alpinitundrae]|uniref:HAMP domain-containing protein n=1 Tax=Deinococcus alpinitundrae TaxID=468913 RepID=UPI00137B08DE|nr:HAMP domain-containing protein [Deinococcus alpinitundrae]
MGIQKRNLFMSLRLKLLLSFSLIFTLVFTAIFWWFYTFSTHTARAQLDDYVQAYLAATASGINGDDFEKLLRFPAGSAPDSPIYRRQQAWLEGLHTIEPDEVSYTVLPKSRTEYQIVGDPLRKTDPKHATIFMKTYKLSELKAPPSDGGTNLTPYKDSNGAVTVTGSKAITNSKGDMVGGIGVIFNMTHVQKVQQAIKDQIWLVFLVSYMVTFTFVYFVSTLLTQPIGRLTSMASRVGHGDYTSNFAEFERSQLRDEISTLGAVFAQMVEQVHKREQTLKHEVQSLRIEIDGARKAKEVKEIVETDNFRNLKDKAKEMRSRAQGAGRTLIPEG